MILSVDLLDNQRIFFLLGEQFVLNMFRDT